jgi:hypothetical protein
MYGKRAARACNLANIPTPEPKTCDKKTVSSYAASLDSTDRDVQHMLLLIGQQRVVAMCCCDGASTAAGIASVLEMRWNGTAPTAHTK